MYQGKIIILNNGLSSNIEKVLFEMKRSHSMVHVGTGHLAPRSVHVLAPLVAESRPSLRSTFSPSRDFTRSLERWLVRNSCLLECVRSRSPTRPQENNNPAVPVFYWRANKVSGVCNSIGICECRHFNDGIQPAAWTDCKHNFKFLKPPMNAFTYF